MGDMPTLNDSKRILRICLMLDEAVDMQHAYFNKRYDAIRRSISGTEFLWCGGNENGLSPLYRQLVYAKRDAQAYSVRCVFPECPCIRKAHRDLLFLRGEKRRAGGRGNKSVQKEKDAAFEKGREFQYRMFDVFRMRRAYLVLKKVRQFIKESGGDIASVEAGRRFANLKLTRREFYFCGGKKTRESQSVRNFPIQHVIKLAKEGMMEILQNGRSNMMDYFAWRQKKKKVTGVIPRCQTCISSDEEGNAIDEEDV